MRAFFLFTAMLTGLISGGPLATNSTATMNAAATSNSTGRWGHTYATIISGTVTDAASGAPLVLEAPLPDDLLVLDALLASA